MIEFCIKCSVVEILWLFTQKGVVFTLDKFHQLLSHFILDREQSTGSGHKIYTRDSCNGTLEHKDSTFRTVVNQLFSIRCLEGI